MDNETLSEMPKATGIVMGTTAENASSLGAFATKLPSFTP